MAEVATTIPPKGLLSLKWYDLIKGIYYACAGAILKVVYEVINSLLQVHPHFPTWEQILPSVSNLVWTVIGYLVAKLGVNNVGQIFTKDKPVVHVDATELKELQAKVTVNDPT